MTRDELIEKMEKEMFLKLMINPYWIKLQHNTELCTGISEYLANDVLQVVIDNLDSIVGIGTAYIKPEFRRGK